MKKSVVLFAAFAALMSSTLFAVAPTDFMKKIPISIGTDAQTALGGKSAENVPVLVRISESGISGFDYDDLATDGSDLAFGVDDGSSITVYPHEIDTWNSEGESLVWVKVPVLSASTAFNMYYGNGVSGGAAASSTWSNYTGVWHLNDTNSASAYGTYPNSSSLGTLADGEKAELSFADQEGRFGKSFRVNDGGTNSGNFNYGGVFVNDSDALGVSNVFTLSGWFKHADQNYYYDHFFYKRERNDNGAGASGETGAFAIELSAKNQIANKFTIKGNGSTSYAPNPATSYNYKNWNYFTFVFNKTSCTLYINGDKISSGTINEASRNRSRLAFGNNVCAYGNGKGDAAYCGWIDEVRLSGGTVRTDDYVALEYMAMTDNAMLSFGSVQTMDPTMPKFESLSVVRNDGNTGFDVSYVLKSGGGSFKAVIVDAATGETAYEAAFAATSLSVASTDLKANGIYDVSIDGVSTAGNPFSKFVGRIYNGAVSVAKVVDADETTLTSGRFSVSVASPLAADFEFAYAVGGTAVGGESYVALSGKVLIPSGSSAAEIEVRPIYTSEVTENVTVSVDLSEERGVMLGESSSAELMIVNSADDPYARYVSPSGSSGGTGKRDAPYATIDQALATLTEVGGTIWLDTGTYSLSSTVLLSTPVTIRSVSGDPADVTINKASGNITLIKLNHAEAKLLDITVSGGGNNTVDGGNVYIDANGGIVEHCIIENGDVNATYGKAGGNVYMKSGIVTRCVIRGGKANYNGGGGGVWMSGGQVENCLIDGNFGGGENSATYFGDAGGGVHMTGADAKLVNCTLVRNRGNKSPAVQIDYDSKAKAPKGTVINCVIVDNLTMNGTWDFYNVGGAKESAAAFVNCMTDARIAQPNESCFAGPIGFADRFNGDYRLLGACGAVDAGAVVTLYSDLDLDGNPRTSGTSIDVGCYELQQTSASVGAAVSDVEVLVGEEVTFTAAAFGGATGEVLWSFGEGEEGATGAEVTHAFVSEGWKEVTATVGGQSCTVKVKVCPVELEIANGDDLVEKFAWATDGTTVKIAPDTYEINTHIIVDKAIRVEGMGEMPADVVIKATGSMRVFWLSHPDAFITGLTMLNGKVYQSYGGNCYICDWGGTVSNCVFASGTADNYNGNAGNLYQMAGLVTHCVLTNSLVNNTGGGSKGGNVVITGGRLENSLVANGRDTSKGDNAALTAGLRVAGGKVLNCTIAGNDSKTCGGVSSSGSGTIENCVIAGNGGATPVRVDPPKSGDADYGVFVNCAIDTTEPINGTCIAATAGALMVDVVNKDFHAAAGSPSIDFPGASDDGAPEVDLAGNQRIQGKGIDLGCYEYEAGQLAVTFDSDIKQAVCPVEVTFTATVDGADDGDVLSYGWDYNGDGVVDETTDEPVTKHTWTVGGTYTIGLYVSNETSGQNAQAIKPDMEKFAPAVMYVDAEGDDPVVPFADWKTAATNLSDAIEAAVDGCEIVVAKGLYANGKRPLVEKNIHIRGETGNPDDTVFVCKYHGSLFVNAELALVDSITFTNGFSASSTDAGIEFGVHGGTVSNCVVRNTSAQNWNGSGSAIYCPYTGFVTHCRFYDCKLEGACGGGSKPIVYLPKGRLENSFFTGCSDTFKADDDHIQMIYVGSGGSVVNCTFVGNTAGDCHFLEVGAGGVISNTVFAANTFPAKVDGDVWTGFHQEGIDLDAAFVNCATDFGEPLNATCKVGTLETMFKGYTTGDLVPKAGGPLYNAGVSPSGWEKITDLVGKPRVAGKRIDIGCYESDPIGLRVLLR